MSGEAKGLQQQGLQRWGLCHQSWDLNLGGEIKGSKALTSFHRHIARFRVVGQAVSLDLDPEGFLILDFFRVI